MSRLLLFAHGAGLGSGSPWMTAWARLLGALGTVRTFDYPYMAAGRKAPDRLPKLIARHREALAEARADHDGPVVLIGKSMGSRVGCHVANAEPVDAVVTLGYPLVSIRGTSVRDEVLVALRTPILLVQGTRDRLCPLDRLAEVRPRMSAPNTLHVVEGGDHSLKLRKRDLKELGVDQEEADRRAVTAIGAWLDETL